MYTYISNQITPNTHTYTFIAYYPCARFCDQCWWFDTIQGDNIVSPESSIPRELHPCVPKMQRLYHRLSLKNDFFKIQCSFLNLLQEIKKSN